MCVIKDKLKNACEWIKIFVYLIGISSAFIICLSSIITIPNRVNDHEVRISKVEKDINDIKIETVAKLTSLQEDVRLIKEVLIKRK